MRRIKCKSFSNFLTLRFFTSGPPEICSVKELNSTLHKYPNFKQVDPQLLKQIISDAAKILSRPTAASDDHDAQVAYSELLRMSNTWSYSSPLRLELLCVIVSNFNCFEPFHQSYASERSDYLVDAIKFVRKEGKVPAISKFIRLNLEASSAGECTCSLQFSKVFFGIQTSLRIRLEKIPKHLPWEKDLQIFVGWSEMLAKMHENVTETSNDLLIFKDHVLNIMNELFNRYDFAAGRFYPTAMISLYKLVRQECSFDRKVRILQYLLNGIPHTLDQCRYMLRECEMSEKLEENEMFLSAKLCLAHQKYQTTDSIECLNWLVKTSERLISSGPQTNFDLINSWFSALVSRKLYKIVGDLIANDNIIDWRIEDNVKKAFLGCLHENKGVLLQIFPHKVFQLILRAYQSSSDEKIIKKLVICMVQNNYYLLLEMLFMTSVHSFNSPSVVKSTHVCFIIKALGAHVDNKSPSDSLKKWIVKHQIKISQNDSSRNAISTIAFLNWILFFVQQFGVPSSPSTRSIFTSSPILENRPVELNFVERILRKEIKIPKPL